MWKKSFPATMLVRSRNHQAWMVVIPSTALSSVFVPVYISNLEKTTFDIVLLHETTDLIQGQSALSHLWRFVFPVTASSSSSLYM